MSKDSSYRYTYHFKASKYKGGLLYSTQGRSFDH
jgi:hypothetical protein